MAEARDHPLPFFDVSWLAVPDATADDLLRELDLSDAREVTWEEGLAAVCGDYWDFQAPLDKRLWRVFLTAQVGRWRLVVGGWLGGTKRSGLNKIAALCRRLSTRYGTACAFTTQGRIDWYAWIIARDGTIRRRFEWGDWELRAEGEPTAAEQHSRDDAANAGKEWRPRERDVMAVAGEASVNPSDFGLETPASGVGLLATTAWGRKQAALFRLKG